MTESVTINGLVFVSAETVYKEYSCARWNYWTYAEGLRFTLTESQFSKMARAGRKGRLSEVISIKARSFKRDWALLVIIQITTRGMKMELPTHINHVEPKPWIFGYGHYPNVTPGKRYRVLQRMTASEWYREPSNLEGTFMELQGDDGLYHWFYFSESYWETVEG